MVVEDVGGVEGIVSVGFEHVGRYLVVPDEGLDIVELGRVAEMPLGYFVGVGVVVVAVEEWACFHHFPEGFVLLGASLMLHCHLSQLDPIGANTHILLLVIVTY